MVLPMGTLPKIIWVAARPPVPPFSGITGKTLCGLDALSAYTEVDLVTFVDRLFLERCKCALYEYWGDRPISFHILPKREIHAIHSLYAITRRRFSSGLIFPAELLAAKLTELKWHSFDRLVIFDDIVLAPFGRQYGHNAILSPHDCMSRMFFSHFKLQPFSFHKFRKLLQFMIAREYEKKFYHHFLLVHVITQRDRVLLQQINPSARYHVVPNSDLLNPGLIRNWDSSWDILIWGDLSIPSCALGAREFLTYAQKNHRVAGARKLLVGRVSAKEALRLLGQEIMTQITYSPQLEDETGYIRSAKIIVIPDLGGAGIKNRVVNVLSSGLCLACLISQMEGVEAIADRGAINAATMRELVAKIAWALETQEYKQIANRGQRLYQEYYSLESIRKLWRETLERALSVRYWLAASNSDDRF